jgi:hypothetical protein
LGILLGTLNSLDPTVSVAVETLGGSWVDIETLGEMSVVNWIDTDTAVLGGVYVETEISVVVWVDTEATERE